MTSHELAKILLEGPNLPISTHANNHTCNNSKHMRVCVIKTFDGSLHIGIGDFSERHISYPNDFVVVEIDGGEVLPDTY